MPLITREAVSTTRPLQVAMELGSNDAIKRAVALGRDRAASPLIAAVRDVAAALPRKPRA